MSILERLYNGNLCPIEEAIPPDKDYRSLLNEIGNEREYFAGIFSVEDKGRFEEWNRKIFRYEEMVEYENFSYGFRLGVMLAHEVFAERESR